MTGVPWETILIEGLTLAAILAALLAIAMWIYTETSAIREMMTGHVRDRQESLLAIELRMREELTESRHLLRSEMQNAYAHEEVDRRRLQAQIDRQEKIIHDLELWRAEMRAPRERQG